MCGFSDHSGGVYDPAEDHYMTLCEKAIQPTIGQCRVGVIVQI